MNRYSTEQRCFMVLFYRDTNSPSEAVKLFKKKFGNHHNIDPKTIKRVFDKFMTTGSVMDYKEGMQTKKNTVIVEENVKKVEELIKQSPSTSIRMASKQLDISKSSVQRIIKKELSLFPYKIQTNQPINQLSGERRLEFANQMLTMAENNDIDFGNILFSDEAHFQMEGYVNKQNCRIWGSENPHYSIIKPLHPKRLTVWCGISSEMIIGPVIFSENIKSTVYLNILQEQVVPYLYGLGKISDFYFMQDGARPHRTCEVFDYLSEHFDGRIIGLDSEKFTGKGICWPPYSPDLNPCDYFLWGFIKDGIYRTPVVNLEDLKNRIEARIREITPEMLKRVVNNFEQRLRNVIVSEGSHFENLLY